MDWPVRGLLWFAARPALWLRPLLAHGLALAVLVAVAGGIIWLGWPGAGHPWWSLALRAAGAVALGLAGALVAWSLLVPLLLAPVLDSLAAAVFRERGLAAVESPVLRSVADSLAVVVGTIPLRLRWLGFGLLGFVLGPAGPLLGAYALARVAVVDATDIALGVRGVAAGERLAGYRTGAGALRRAALVAAALQVPLAATFVGWLFWMPGLVCGAALRIAGREAAAGGGVTAGGDPSRR